MLAEVERLPACESQEREADKVPYRNAAQGWWRSAQPVQEQERQHADADRSRRQLARLGPKDGPSADDEDHQEQRRPVMKEEVRARSCFYPVEARYQRRSKQCQRWKGMDDSKHPPANGSHQHIPSFHHDTSPSPSVAVRDD